MQGEKLITELQALGAQFALEADGFRVIADRGVVTDAERQQLAAHKPEICRLLQTEAARAQMPASCPQCGAAVACRELVTRWEAQCTAESLHYTEHRRKPGAAYLWEGVAEVEARHYGLAHLGEDELPSPKVRRCLVGCRSLVKYYGGLGYCPVCEVHQEIAEDAMS